MRAYLPIRWSDLRTLYASGELRGSRRACVVDPQWRAEDAEVDEEEWEFAAQLLAAQALADREGGLLLALDLDPEPTQAPVDGWLAVPGPLRRTQIAALLTEDLAWYGVQELGDLLDRQ